MFLPAQEIRKRCQGPSPMIMPFAEQAYSDGVSYGLGPASYSIRTIEHIILWPGKSVRVDALERFNMPEDVIGLMYSKSTWARLHIEHAGTVIDPGFKGVLRLEINMHHGDDVINIKAGTGIAQIVFGLLTVPTDKPYKGKYQNQRQDQDAMFSDPTWQNPLSLPKEGWKS